MVLTPAHCLPQVRNLPPVLRPKAAQEAIKQDSRKGRGNKAKEGDDDEEME